MNLRPTSEMAPLIRSMANRLRALDDSMVLVTCCAAAEVLRGRGIKTAILVKALIDAAVADEIASQGFPIPRPRGEG